MLQIHKISKEYSGNVILDNVSFSLSTGDVAALIGSNGTGKTTMLKIIVGDILPDNGFVRLNAEAVYVAQNINNQRITIDEYFSIADKWLVKAALDRVGLHNLSIKTIIQNLSEGEKTKLSIAKIFAGSIKPKLLLLDEPTNNLDTFTKHWLSKFIKEFKGALLMVSHDRDFINSNANKVFELHSGEVKYYFGNYNDYKAQKKQKLEYENEKYLEYSSQRNKLQKNMIKFKDLTNKASNVSFDKTKHESKMVFNEGKNYSQKSFGKKIKAINSKLSQLEEVKKPKLDKYYNINIAGEVHANKKIFDGLNIYKGFGSKKVLNDFEISIKGRDRIAILGPNGSGKSTALKIIAKQINVDSGNLSWGNGLKTGYYAQDTELLHTSKTAYQNLKDNGIDDADIYYQCRKLGLRSSILTSKVKCLSRGQQAKIAFCKLILEENDILILDEPTNHMDIETRELLESALNHYQGAILVASHDKYFLDKINIDKNIDLAK